MKTQFNPTEFTQIRGVFTSSQLRLATQVKSMGDGTILATFSDSILRDYPALRDVPTSKTTEFGPVLNLPVISYHGKVEKETLVGRRIEVSLFNDVRTKTGVPARQLRDQFQGKIIEQNGTWVRIELDPNCTSSSHKISEREWFNTAGDNRLIETYVKGQ
jgi:hypothetical protein